MTDRNSDERIEAIQDRLALLDGERQALQNELVSIERQHRTPKNDVRPGSAVTAASPADQKVALFRRLFAGREDVFPLRWQNPKTASPDTPLRARTNGNRESVVIDCIRKIGSRVGGGAFASPRKAP